MDVKISFEPLSPTAPDLFMTVDDDGIEDALAIAKTTAAANFPISLIFVIHDAYGVLLERWEHEDGAWRRDEVASNRDQDDR
jgi:hypothetical protein